MFNLIIHSKYKNFICKIKLNIHKIKKYYQSTGKNLYAGIKKNSHDYQNPDVCAKMYKILIK